MAIARTQTVGSVGSVGTQAGVALTLSGITTVVGRHLILSFIGSGQVITSIADSKGNTWQIDDTDSTSGTAKSATCSARITVALVNGDTITPTLGANTSHAFWVEEYSGLAAAGWFDQAISTGSDTAATAADSGATGTLAQADSLIIGTIGQGGAASAVTPEVLSPVWNLRGTIASTSTIRTVSHMDRIVAVTTAVSAKATWTTARAWVAAAVVYKGAAAAVDMPYTPRQMAQLLAH